MSQSLNGKAATCESMWRFFYVIAGLCVAFVIFLDLYPGTVEKRQNYCKITTTE